MKSRVFATLFEDPDSDKAKQFLRHLQDLLQLEPAARAQCLRTLPHLRAPQTPTQEREVIDKLASSTSIERAKLVNALSVLDFFVDALLAYRIPEDDWTHWADDLMALSALGANTKPVFESLLSEIRTDLPALRQQDLERTAKGGVFPTFKSFGYTVEIRPIRRDFFRWGRPAEEYDPEILGSVMLVSFAIGVNEGLVEDFYFQATEEDIDNMIATLMAAKKEMACFRNYLKLPNTR